MIYSFKSLCQCSFAGVIVTRVGVFDLVVVWLLNTSSVECLSRGGKMDARFMHPWTMICAGPTSAGKTVFVQRFLKQLDVLANVKFERILFYYGEWQDSYRVSNVEIEFREGLPRNEDYSNDPEVRKLIIIDDLMRESSNNATIIDLFSKGSHHRNASVIYICQNIFHKGQRDISLNANYMVLFKNPRDRAQIQHLARQLYPEDSRFLQEAYYDSTIKPYSYLLIDLKQSTPEELRFRSCIFPDDEYQYVYIPKYSSSSYIKLSGV